MLSKLTLEILTWKLKRIIQNVVKVLERDTTAIIPARAGKLVIGLAENGKMKINEVVGITEEEFEKLAEKKDACYHKVKSRYKVWPSAYASGALVQCRKKGAANWGNKSKK